MVNDIFFKKKKDFLTLDEVLKITNSKLLDNNIDKNQKISGVATLKEAVLGQITFINSASYLNDLQNSKASFCFLEEKYSSKLPKDIIGLIHHNPYFAYAVFLDNFYESKEDYDSGVSNKAAIAQTAIIGEGTKIAYGAYVGNNVKIGKNCVIGANAVIMDNCVIGDNVKIDPLALVSHAIIGNNSRIYNGAKIGQDGFGFAHEKGVNHKILQLGAVIIGDNVEIGANSCVDRGAIEDTVIANGVKIDNLVQVGHNVKIGEGSVLAGCSAVAGSVKIGRFVQVGGHSAISGHLSIGDGAKIAGKSGVVKDVKPMQVVGGLPAMPIKDWHRSSLKLMQLARIKRQD